MADSARADAPLHSVRLVGEQLRFAAAAGSARPPSPAAPGSVLTDFCALLGQQAEQVLAFARTHGPLQLCKHGLLVGEGKEHAEADPLSSVPGRVVLNSGGPRRKCDVEHPQDAPAEHLVHWDAWARRFSGMRRVAMALRAETEPKAADVEDAFYGLVIGGQIADALKADGVPAIARRHDFDSWLNYLLTQIGSAWRVQGGKRHHLDDGHRGLSPSCPLFSALVLDIVGLATGEEQPGAPQANA